MPNRMRKTFMVLLSVVIVLMQFPHMALADAQNGVVVFGGTNADTLMSAVELEDNGFVVAVSSSSSNGDMSSIHKGNTDIVTVRYNADGSINWKRSFGGSGPDDPKGIARLQDGSFLVVGQSASTDGDMQGLSKGNLADAVVIKYNPSGNMVWTRSFGGNGEDVFTAAVPLPDGGFIAVGYSNSGDVDLQGLNKGNYDGTIVRYNSNGDVVWKRTFGGSASDQFGNVVYTQDGGIVVLGHTLSNDGDVNGMLHTSPPDAVIVKYDLNGNVQWSDVFGGDNYDMFVSAIQAQNGNIVVTGYSGSADGDLQNVTKYGAWDGIVVEYDHQGNVVWKKAYGGSLTETFQGIAETDGGYVIVGGSMSTDGMMQNINKGSMDAIIMKVDYDGNWLWTRSFGGSNSDIFARISILPFGGIIATGESSSANGDMQNLSLGDRDAIIVKYDENGNLVPFEHPLDAATFAPGTSAPTNQDVVVSINYPANAVVKQYKIDGGSWQNYNGPITMTQNGTIHAKSESAHGTRSYDSDYTVDNIDKDPPTAPVIVPDTVSPTAGPVTLTITYPADATVTEYKIGEESDWEDYLGSIAVTSNTTVYAQAIDEAGNTSHAEYEVTNITLEDPGNGGDNPTNPDLRCDDNGTCNILPGMNKVDKKKYIIAQKRDYVDIEALVPSNYNSVTDRWN